MRSRAIFVLLTLPLFALFLFQLGSASPEQPKVLTVRIEGTITTATSNLVKEALEYAIVNRYDTLLITMDTTGGLLSATFEIVDAIERSKIPVIVYVYPSGSRGWSAGTFILLASHVAAMAPYSLIGSCQPISYSPFGDPEPIRDEKTINALTAYIAERARMHGRNETAAKLFVTHNLNLNEELALRYGVIDVVASEIDELLTKINGKSVEVLGQNFTLNTKGAVVHHYEPSLRVMFLNIINDPIIASLAFLVGLYALIFGISAPGHLAEIIGAFLLILGLIGLGFNINIAALLFLIIGAILMIAEAYTPGFGILGGSGFLFIIVGSLLLIPFGSIQWLASEDFYRIFFGIIISSALVIGGFTLFMVYKVVKARRRKPLIKDIINEIVYVVDELGPDKYGFVKYSGEYWTAKSQETIKPGSKAVVIGKEGHVLVVKRLEEK
ncbi:MAG: nodulation protein NfeD [Nitrososphaerota archaeon]|nr:nodulation protein NfeD [Aigarchaeota archaeon]MDW8076939.1 nodulation protein NfeD [Nitrososphaerota archaeon]